MTPLRIPRASLTMEEARVVRWLVPQGASVEAGQPVVEIETDKSTLEVESPAGGVLRILAEAGAAVPADAVIAEIGMVVEGEARS
ncbi:MAG: lipoyl domain-containing protein [Alphaproteobacteria bacterium]